MHPTMVIVRDKFERAFAFAEKALAKAPGAKPTIHIGNSGSVFCTVSAGGDTAKGPRPDLSLREDSEGTHVAVYIDMETAWFCRRAGSEDIDQAIVEWLKVSGTPE